MTQDLQKVSIIIPCYNSEEYIQECIESVLKQDYKNIEVIVIDDGSTDNSVGKLKPYLNKIILITQENQGACVARNKGLEVATGEFIKFLDSDDYLEKNIISSQVKKIKLLDDRSIVFGDLTQKHGYTYVRREYKSIDPKKTIETLINNGIITSLPLHRKKLLHNINGFDPRFKNYQEWNLHIRLAASGVKFIHFPENVYFQRFHNSPDRISNQTNIDHVYEINKRLITLESINHSQIMSESIKQAMAYNLWIEARERLLSNSPISAEACYQASMEIHPNISRYFPAHYNFLVFITNNIFTEKLIYARKKFTKSRKIFFAKLKN